MKLDFTPRLTKVSYTDLCRQLKRTSKRLGSGAYANAYQHPTKKTRVLKVSLCDDKPANDGYYAFIKRITKLRKQNPFLPKVHSVKVFKKPLLRDAYDRGHQWYFVVELDKLVEYKKINRTERYAWYDRVVGDGRKAPRPTSWYETYEMRLYTDPHPRVDNKDLKQANKVIKRLGRGQFFHDDHLGNIMWRVRSNGKHVVFIDPIA